MAKQRALAVIATVWCVILQGCGAPAPISRDELLTHQYSVRDPQFIQVMGNLLGPSYLEGNSITTLIDGPQIFPAMLDAIRSAQRSITFETYVFWDGKIPLEFSTALAERAQAGVKVHLLIDAVGSDRIDGAHVKLMEDAGVEFVRYNPPEKILLLFTAPRVNNRTHRKLLIVDGVVAFTGGIGIADVWMGDDDNPNPWRETFYRIEGPAVAQLQSVFMDNWMETRGQLLDGEAYFPILKSRGNIPVQVIRSSPEHGSATLELVYLLAINAAESSVYIGNAYFVPNDLLIKTMIAAAKRGVTVKIVTPGPHNDQQIVRLASRARWNELLEAGIEIYEYQPAMLHYKVMVVDGMWTTAGSANLDPRSLRLSDEANINVFDQEFALLHEQMIQRDIEQSDRITEVEHEKRSLLGRLGEFFSSLLAPQL